MKPALQKGQLTTWKDDRGFAFIKPDNSGVVRYSLANVKQCVDSQLYRSLNPLLSLVFHKANARIKRVWSERAKCLLMPN